MVDYCDGVTQTAANYADSLNDATCIATDIVSLWIDNTYTATNFVYLLDDVTCTAINTLLCFNDVTYIATKK